ncbi:hypothetical protein [Streptomyces sp. NPDC048172]|uniref:hypothetical protein n=1 Tax=Streptomyces sp. NPDC048172 TaxID=3365505 RepID=UPI0037141978
MRLLFDTTTGVQTLTREEHAAFEESLSAGTALFSSVDTICGSAPESVELIEYQLPGAGREYAVWERGVERSRAAVGGLDALDELYEQWVHERVRRQERLMRESDVSGCGRYDPTAPHNPEDPTRRDLTAVCRAAEDGGYVLQVMRDGSDLPLVERDLSYWPDWPAFPPEAGYEAGCQLVLCGIVIWPDTMTPDSVYGWRPVPGQRAWSAQVAGHGQLEAAGF